MTQSVVRVGAESLSAIGITGRVGRVGCVLRCRHEGSVG